MTIFEKFLEEQNLEKNIKNLLINIKNILILIT